MSQPFAVGRKAFGFCDRCDQRYLLHDLKDEVVDLNKTGLLVCPECFDKDNPQSQLGRWPVTGPQALRNPRPDTGQAASRYGDSIRWDFDTSTDSWVSSASAGSPSMTLAWVSADEEMTAAGIAGQKTPIIMRDSGADNSAAVSIAAADYRYVRLRFKRTASWVSSGGGSGWTGTLYWNTSGSAFTSAKSISAPEPIWNQMGDPYRELEWAVYEDANWTGTVDKLKIEFHAIGGDTWTSLGSYSIDYIRAEKA